MYIDFHEIFYAKFPNIFVEWVQRLKDNNPTHWHDRPRRWTPKEVRQMEEVINKISCGVNLWFESGLKGYIVEFIVELMISYTIME